MLLNTETYLCWSSVSWAYALNEHTSVKSPPPPCLSGSKDAPVKSQRSKAMLCYAKSLQSCPTLCDPIDGSPPGSPVPGILQARTHGVGCHFLLQCMRVKSESEVAQSCPTLSDPMDCSLPGSSIHGIFQARILEWNAISFSRTIVYYALKLS